VRLFVGGAPNPDGTANPPLTPPYHVYGYEDDDPVGTCTTNLATRVYAQTLNGSDKLWAAPASVGDSVYFATSAGTSESVCATGSSTFFGIKSTGATSSAYALSGGSASLPGAAVSSISIYDGHGFINTVGGLTTQIGGSGWNNNHGNAMPPSGALPRVLWTEQ
jgi:hypothetical protein